MKTCKKCGDSKSFDDFYKRKLYKDGYDHKCKSCCISISTENNKKNPNTNEYLKKYRSKEHVKEKEKQHKHNDRERISKVQKKYCDKNKHARKMKHLMKDD